VRGAERAPDNASFASCGGDKAVLIWDVASGTITRRLQGHFGKINVVRYAGGGAGAKDGGGNVLVSGSFDSKVMLWDMRYVPLLVLWFFRWLMCGGAGRWRGCRSRRCRRPGTRLRRFLSHPPRLAGRRLLRDVWTAS
jgi:WD40 repeat protein